MPLPTSARIPTDLLKIVTCQVGDLKCERNTYSRTALCTVFTAVGEFGRVCSETVGLAASGDLQEGLEEMGVIEYLVASYILDGLKSPWRDRLEK